MRLLPIIFGPDDGSGASYRKRLAALCFAAILAGIATPSICRAGSEQSSSVLPVSVLPVALPGLTALPDSSIAAVTGTGLQAAPITGNTGANTPIVLWDELRPATPQTMINSGSVTITVNGVVQ
jgi:hypothetical protein